MHIEILSEDSSGQKLLEILVPQILGEQGEPHTWSIHSYKGIGRIPRDLGKAQDPAKRNLLNQLPRLLKGYGRTPSVDAVLIVLDVDKRNCKDFLLELKGLLDACVPAPKKTMFRLAIEEIEAWYLGDQTALLTAYPRARRELLAKYEQDSPCDTWELLADITVTGGVTELKKRGWPAPGQLKHEWAERIGPMLELDRNNSPSFCRLRDGLRRLVAET